MCFVNQVVPLVMHEMVDSDGTDVDKGARLAHLKQIDRTLQIAYEMCLKVAALEHVPIEAVMNNDISIFNQWRNGFVVVMCTNDKLGNILFDMFAVTRFSHQRGDCISLLSSEFSDG